MKGNNKEYITWNCTSTIEKDRGDENISFYKTLTDLGQGELFCHVLMQAIKKNPSGLIKIQDRKG